LFHHLFSRSSSAWFPDGGLTGAPPCGASQRLRRGADDPDCLNASPSESSDLRGSLSHTSLSHTHTNHPGAEDSDGSESEVLVGDPDGFKLTSAADSECGRWWPRRPARPCVATEARGRRLRHGPTPCTPCDHWQRQGQKLIDQGPRRLRTQAKARGRLDAWTPVSLWTYRSSRPVTTGPDL
jgi:hypothetical protein